MTCDSSTCHNRTIYTKGSGLIMKVFIDEKTLTLLELNAYSFIDMPSDNKVGEKHAIR